MEISATEKLMDAQEKKEHKEKEKLNNEIMSYYNQEINTSFDYIVSNKLEEKLMNANRIDLEWKDRPWTPTVHFS